MNTNHIIQSVADVELATNPLEEIAAIQSMESLLDRPVEACSESEENVVPCSSHAFVAAIHAAYADHRPLVLSPDMFWLLIMQGFALHLRLHSEDYRSRLVKHKGKTDITVRRDDFLKGSRRNPWPEVFGEFSSAIKEHIGQENHANIMTEFSTTGPVEKAAFDIALMDSVQNYFKYRLVTLCGIPRVILEGTAKDWENLVNQTQRIGLAYDMEWWTNRLIPRLSAMARNAAGENNPELWLEIYKEIGGSGGPFINGWIIDFFPYLQMDHDPSPQPRTEVTPTNFIKTVEACDECFLGITSVALPSALSQAPFIWNYLGRKFSMDFVAGFTGFNQDSATLAVRPQIGWAVCARQE